MSSLVIRLFGSLEVLIDGDPMPRLRSRKGQLLLAHLVLRAGQDVSRESLCEILWPDNFIDQARLSLRQSLVDLRKALGPEAGRIEAQGATGLRFEANGAEIDVVAFDVISRSSEPKLVDLDLAIRAYRGPLLDGLRDDSITGEREARREAYLTLLTRRAEKALAVNDGPAAVAALRKATAASPLHEASYRMLMRTLADQGHLAEGLEVFRRLRSHLRESVAADPDAQTVALYESLRARVATPSAPADRALRTEGVRLPRPLTSLVGRGYEEASVGALLTAHRLVTLTGLGGIGKTRLAIEVARHVAETEPAFEVAFVSFAHVQNPQTVTEAVRTALGMKDPKPLLNWIGDRRLLLVADNCESALEDIAEFLSEALEACPQLRVLATSRASLSILGEKVVTLRPLETAEEGSPIEVLEASPACALMLDRMGLTSTRRPGEREIRLAAEIARRLDGIPLAIELAAAQSRALPLPDLLARIDRPLEVLRSEERGRPVRHQTMEATIQGSHELLDEPTQVSFRTLGIFTGGFTFEAAEAVCPEGTAVVTLRRLVDASFVEFRDDRYGMLETIRQFALERLRESGEYEPVRQRHFRECLRFASVARPQLMGADQLLWMRRLDAERDNMRFALGTCEDNQAFYDLLNSLFFHWHLASNTAEAERWFAEAHRRTEGVAKASLSRMYAGAGTMAWHRMELDAARGYLEKAVAFARESEDQASLFSALNAYGIVLRMMGELEAAYVATTESVVYIRATKDPARLARGLANLGRVAAALAQYTEGEAIFAESLDLFRQVGDERDHAHTQQSFATMLGDAGRYEESKAIHLEAIETLTRLEDTYRLAWSFSNILDLCIHISDFHRGAYLFGIVRALERRHGFEVLNDRNPGIRDPNEVLSAQLGHADIQRILTETREWTWREGVELARAVCLSEP